MPDQPIRNPWSRLNGLVVPGNIIQKIKQNELRIEKVAGADVAVAGGASISLFYQNGKWRDW